VARKKSLKKFKDAIRRKTKRANGHSMERIAAELTPMLRGWFEYFKHSNKWTFPPLDSWIRRRLRSILRKRKNRRGSVAAVIISAGQTSTFGTLGSFALQTPIVPYSSPRRGDPPTGEPDAGEPHVRFRREGWRKPMRHSYPIKGLPPVVRFSLRQSLRARGRPRPVIKTGGSD